MATVDQQIDALLKRDKNPAPARKTLFVATRSKQKALDHAATKGINNGIAVKVAGGFVVYQAYEDAAPNPARKSRKVTLVAASPRSSRNLAAPRKKPRENWPRFVVEEKEGVGPWMPRASFRIIEDAEKLARDIHKAQPSIAVRVIDTKS